MKQRSLFGKNAAAKGARKARGRESDQLGKRWEKVIEKEHNFYKKSGLAAITKIHTPATIAGESYVNAARGPRITPMILQARRSVDYYGVLRGGRCIKIEAKATRKDAISRSIFREKEHQLEDLRLCHNLGGVAAFLFATAQGVWYLPWAGWVSHPRGLFDQDVLDVNGVRLGGQIESASIMAGTFGGRLEYLEKAAGRGFI